MSWSVNASGKPKDVKDELARQFLYPLAPAPSGLSDAGERETVLRIETAINQCLETFDPNKPVKVSANGHMAFDDYTTKTGPSQTVHLSIEPGG